MIYNKLSGQAKPVAMAELGKQYIIVLYKSFAVKWGWDGSIGHIWGTTDLVDAHGIAVDSKGESPSMEHCMWLCHLQHIQLTTE